MNADARTTARRLRNIDSAFFRRSDGHSRRDCSLREAYAPLLRDRAAGRRDLGLHGVEVEARALLHRRELDRGHRPLLDLPLDEYEAPELVLEPVEVLLRAFLGAAVGPARALERIEPQVGQVRDVGPGLVAYPATRLVDEAVLVVVDADGTELALAEVPDLVPVRRALAGDHVHLIVAVEIDLVVAIAELLALLELLADVGIAGCRDQRREPVEPRDQAVLDLAGRHLAGPADHRRRAEAAFHHRALGLGERGLTAVRPGEE